MSTTTPRMTRAEATSALIAVERKIAQRREFCGSVYAARVAKNDEWQRDELRAALYRELLAAMTLEGR